METRDSNGTLLADGDNVTLIKDLKVKGTSTTLKRGTIVKGIRLTGDPDEIDCKAGGVADRVRQESLRDGACAPPVSRRAAARNRHGR
jgi:protein PhnA